MPKQRANPQEFEKRLLSVQVWIIENVPNSLIIKQILDKGWVQSTRQAQRYLTAALDRWVEHEGDDIAKKRRMKIQQLKQLTRTLQEKYKGTPEGIRAIVAVEKEIIKLEGISQPIKLEHSGPEGQPIPIENKTNVDYTKLSTEVLKAIVNARIKPAI